MPGHVHTHRDFVLNWHRQKRGRINFEIGERGRNCPRNVSLAALCLQFERHLLELGSLARELNLQIGVDRRRCGGRFRESRAYGDHGKLRPPRDLQHMEVAVAVSGIERLDGNRDQEVALPAVADTLTSRRMAYAFCLMQRMRHVVSESALLKDPLTIGSSKAGECHEAKTN